MGTADPETAELSVPDYGQLGPLAEYIRLAVPSARVTRSPGRPGSSEQGALDVVMIVADSSKLGQRAFARVCATDEIAVVVTDRDARPDLLAALTERGIRVVTP